MWVIGRAMNPDGNRWIAFPATPETLKRAIDIAELWDGKAFVTIEKAEILNLIAHDRAFQGLFRGQPASFEDFLETLEAFLVEVMGG